MNHGKTVGERTSKRLRSGMRYAYLDAPLLALVTAIARFGMGPSWPHVLHGGDPYHAAGGRSRGGDSNG